MRGVVVSGVLCLASSASAEPPPQNRLAVNAWAGGGLLIGLGLSVHYEHGEVGTTTGVLRFAVVGAANLDDSEYRDREAFCATGGGRWYFGPRGYLAGEIGVAVVRYPGSNSEFEFPSTPTRWGFAVAGRAAIGAHLGRGDIGIAVDAAALGVGVYLGRDFSVW